MNYIHNSHIFITDYFFAFQFDRLVLGELCNHSWLRSAWPGHTHFLHTFFRGKSRVKKSVALAKVATSAFGCATFCVLKMDFFFFALACGSASSVRASHFFISRRKKHFIRFCAHFILNWLFFFFFWLLAAAGCENSGHYLPCEFAQLHILVRRRRASRIGSRRESGQNGHEDEDA